MTDSPRTARVLERLAPPLRQASIRLNRAVAGITLRRLRKAGRRLAAPPFPLRLRRGATFLRAMEDLLIELGPADRLRLLHGPDLRGLLSEVEIWSEVYLSAQAAGTGAPRGSRRRVARLFDWISRTEHLVDLVPGGCVDPGFPARSARRAVRRLQDALGDLPALLLGARLAFLGGGGAFEGRLGTRESADQGRPEGQADLGSFCGPAGPLALVGRGLSGRAAKGPLRVRLRRGVLAVRRTGGRETLIPLAASSLRFPWVPDGSARPIASAPGASGPSLVRRRLIPGTAILLAPALRSSPRSLRVGRDLPRLESRFSRALRLVHLAWPDAHEEILRRTAIVVPVREPGLVSYSLAARPGVSFINVHGKRPAQLADDLLHETAHHLLHDVEETVLLMPRGPETGEVQAFHSPWRGTRRPLHGLLHGAYTFLFRAELFARLLGARARHPAIVGRLLGRDDAAFLRHELRMELSMIRRALKDLDRAAHARLVTPAGRILVRSLRAWHAGLARSRR